MTHRRLFSNPFAVWFGLAATTSEMMVASSQVIASRTARMAGAGLRPTAADSKEFALMGSEKVEAFTESATRLASAWTPAVQNASAQAWAGSAAMFSAALSLAASRSVPQAMVRQRALVDTVTRRASAVLKGSDAAARLTSVALAPVHAKATANAKRLRRLK